MRIRYALALPLLHLAIAAPPMIHQQSEGWRYIPIEQAVEDIDRERPEPARDAMLWNPCYEYRLPSAGRLVLTADFPVALLIGSSADDCALGAIRLIPNRLKYHVRVKTRVIFIDCLLALGIFVQWWLLGGWLDRLYKRSKPTRRWVVPIAIITLGAMVMAPTAFGQQGLAELVNILTGMITLLAWIVLIVMFVVVGAVGAITRMRPLRKIPAALFPR
jgi:hypothetical protein